MRVAKVRYTDKDTGKRETVECSLGKCRGGPLSLSVDVVVSRTDAWKLGIKYLQEHG
ncbi:hypothetical protein D3C76_1096700 [compost metagenome]